MYLLQVKNGLMFAKWKLFDSKNLILKQQILKSCDPAYY